MILILFTISTLNSHSQEYFGVGSNHFHIDLDEEGCGCTWTPISDFLFVGAGSCYCPDGYIYTAGSFIHQIDPITGFPTLLYNVPWPTNGHGMVCMGGGIFYTIGRSNHDSLYLVDVNTSTVSNVGYIGHTVRSDLTLYNGQIYGLTTNGVIQIDQLNPSNSTIVAILSEPFIGTGITTSQFCNHILALEYMAGLHLVKLINIIDGTVTNLCSISDDCFYLNSIYEPLNPVPCEILLTLSCEDGTNTSYYNCLTSEGVPVTDTDIRIFADDHIAEITVRIAPPTPDDPNEVLVMTGSIPNIDVVGSGTNMITLINLGGASVQNFRDALQLIVYKNLSLNPTGGIRTIEIQFTSASGTMSDVAEYFVDVSEIPLIPLDLGPDLEGCVGETITLNAGNPGATFEWSTGDQTQTISVDESGLYMVTVSDGINCPNQDTIEVALLPIIHVALTGDTDICDNEQTTLTIETDTPFPINVTIDADPGSPFVFTGISGMYSFTDLPFVTTTYTITEVVPDQPACIEITDPEQIIEVYPTYIFENEVSLCDGDSIWLGFFWETEAGTYENLLESIYGCDSMVTTYITILPSVQIAQQSTTCDPSAAGIFITHLDNPNGCDTVVTTTVTLLPLDTTLISLSTCVWTQAGITTDTFSNQSGCDSLVITTTSYTPPIDTTFLYQTSCDSSQLGVAQDTLSGLDGCDSLVVLTTTFSLVDTTHLAGTSCIASEIGVFDSLYIDALGCDSLVITTITQGLPDTTLLFQTSCDSSDLGVSQDILTGNDGCDSLIITTVTFSAQDSTFISSSTCDPSAAGTFVTSLINQFGCDSIVTETVSLLPSDATSLTSTTCDPLAAGIFTQVLTNQYGCDSIVTETITLLPGDQTSLASTTCIASQAGVFVTTLTNQFGCDSVITETITLLPGDTTSFVFNTCDPTQVGNVETIYTGQDGCDSLVIETTTLFPLPVVTVQSAIDYNGFDISCAGDADGSAIANASGVAPFVYLWSTSDTDPLITGLSAEDYAVSVTDGNGCTTEGVITLTQPTLFMIGFEISEPDCFYQNLGSLTVKTVGGVAPYTYSIDGTVFQTSPDFTGLSEGIYQITSLDANDCSATEIISIDVPLMVQVELGDNQVISLGDSSLLQAIVNLPFDSLSSVMWTGIDSIDCPNCLTQLVAPIITTAYTVSVTSIDGCADRDSMTITVTTDQNVYIPNIFSPNGDGINDVLSISVGEGVEEISSFEIFDRWGTLVFGAKDILPTDPTISWDGKMKGETMNPGVFTYVLVVSFKDGERVVKYGDITLLR